MTPPVSGARGSWQWGVVGASVVGSEHERRGLGCDDAYCYGVTQDFVVAAVADGAGSVTGTSAWGAYTACQSVLANAMRSRFIREFRSSTAEEAQELIRMLFEKATEHVHTQARHFGLDSAKLATTLCVALADRERAAFGQIGDGVIAVQTDDGIETLLIEAKDDYPNATWFLQSDGAYEESFRTVLRPAVTAFALSTDGMTYKITNVATGEAYEPFFRGSWERVRAGANSANFASLLRSIEDDQTGDDKTMVLATLCWEDDAYYPSPTPVMKLTASSPTPPAVRANTPVAQAIPDEPTQPPPESIEPPADQSLGPAAAPEPDTTPLVKSTSRPRLFRRSEK